MGYGSRLGGMLLAGIVTLVAATARAVVISDGDFDLANYDVVTFATRGGDPMFSYSRELAGGNPGAWLRMQIQQPGAQQSTSIGMFFWKQAYDPGTPGQPAIGTLDFDGDDICLVPDAPGQQCYSSGLVVEQEGDYWTTGIRLAANQFWTPASRRGIRSVDLSRIGHCDDPSVLCQNVGPTIRIKPDFSANAPPLRFGFYTARSGGPFTPHGRDNWSLRINPACTADADCDDADACTVDTCVAGVCQAQDRCRVPGPSVRATVLAQGTTGGVTTDTQADQEKNPTGDLTFTDTAAAQAASTMPAGANGEATSSLGGGLRAKADASLFNPGEFVGATAIARHTRTFDVSGSPGPPPPTFDVNLLVLIDGVLSIRSAINASTPNDIAASVAFDVFVTDGSGNQLDTFQRYASLRAFSDLYFPQIYGTQTWVDSFGPDSNVDPLTHARATNYSEQVTRTITLGTPPRIAVEMRLIAEAHTTPALPAWLAISNFFDTASVQVSSPDPGVVLTEIDPATTTTTLPPRASLTIDDVSTGGRGRGTIRAHCTLTDPSTRKGAKCAVQGMTDGPVAVTKVIKHRFNKRGIAKAVLKLNRTGRQALLTNGTLTVSVLATVTERDGTTTSLQAVATLGGAS